MTRRNRKEELEERLFDWVMRPSIFWDYAIPVLALVLATAAAVISIGRMIMGG